MSEAPVVDAPPVVEEKKFIPLSEIAKHNTVESPWLAINGKVYDVKDFLDQHPGGEEVIMENAGKDATTAFDDVGHSDHAQELLTDMYVGEGNPDELKIVAKKDTVQILDEDSGSSSKIILVVGILVAVAAYYYFKALKD